MPRMAEEQSQTQRRQHHEQRSRTTSHQHRTQTAAARQTAKEMIAANVKSLIEQLEAGHSDALTAYLNAMSRFHNYSFGNMLEIARQKPDATRVAGMYDVEPAWPQGEEGRERHPHSCSHHRHTSARRTRKPRRTSPSRTPAFWLDSVNAYVFDVSQTEGAELPAMREIYGDVGENRDRLRFLHRAQGIELVFTEKSLPHWA